MNHILVNLAKDDSPIFIERADRKDWVEWTVDRKDLYSPNSYPQYIIDCLEKSENHSGIVKDKTQMIGGFGFKYKNLSQKTLDFLENKYGEKLDRILEKISFDNELFGGFCVELIWSNDKKSLTINHIDIGKIRFANPLKYKEGGFFYSDDWCNPRKHTPIYIPAFDPNKKDTQSKGLLYVTEHRPSFKTRLYPVPEYISAISWIETQWEIAQYHKSNIQNGFHPQLMISYKEGALSEDEKRSTTRDLREQYEGSLGSKIIFTFSDPDKVPEFKAIENNDSDTRYIELQGIIRDGILQGHRVKNKALFGVETDGKLGGTSMNEIIESQELFIATYVRPKQRYLENIINDIAKLVGVTEYIKIQEYELNYTRSKIEFNDILRLLESNLDIKTKYELLIYNGYTEETAEKILNIKNGTN